MPSASSFVSKLLLRIGFPELNTEQLRTSKPRNPTARGASYADHSYKSTRLRPMLSTVRKRL